MSTPTPSTAERLLQLVKALWMQAGFTLAIAVLLAAHQGKPAKFAYFAGAIGIAWILQRSRPAAYIGFVLWLWLLSAFVRRVADLYAPGADGNLVLLTPYLASGIWIVSLVEDTLHKPAPARPRPAGLGMFFLAAAGAAAGIPLGLVRSPFTALLETLNFVTPLLLGWYVAARSEHAPEIERQVVTTFGHASFVVGAYGIYQFTRAPAWDTLWMINSEMTTIGSPEPYAIRVFSTMHSPGVLGAFLAVALGLWIAKPRAWGIPAAALAGVTLLLSQVRSAWLQLVVAGLLVVATLKPAQRLRVILLLVLAAMAMSTLFVTPEMSELVNERVSTFEQLDEDKSGLARITGHELALDLVTRKPFGLGIGQTDETIEGYISMRDSTIVAAFVQFGFGGAVMYFAAIGLVFGQFWRYYRRAATPEGVALACAGLGLLATAALGVVSAGPIGACFWLIAGLAVADRHRARVRQAHLRAAAQANARPRVTQRDPVPA